MSITVAPSGPQYAECSTSPGRTYPSIGPSSCATPSTTRACIPRKTIPSCSCGWLWAGTVAPGSNSIRFSIASLPKSGRPSTPATRLNAATSAKRMNCAPTQGLSHRRRSVERARASVAIVTRMAALETDLLREQGYVDGAWVDADSGASFPVIDPATGATIANVPRMGAAETRRAIEAAERALPAWKQRPAKDRARILRRLADLMMERADDLAALLVREQGKPLFEAKLEIAYAASFYEWFGEEAKRLDGSVIQQPLVDRRIVVLREAIGVTAGITPWNFPAAMPTRKSAPALAVGCTMVLKPAEQTPLTALAIAALAEEAGVPPGVFSVVTGDAADAPLIGGEMTSNPIVRKLGFTGSTEIGKLLMAQCAGQVKKVSLELGGNAPFIVFDDADLDEAVAGALLCKYRNSGQTCISANRILVQEGIYDDFVSLLVDGASKLKVGDGLDPGTKVGPLIERSAVDKVRRHVADALDRGGELLLGGES